MPDTIPIVRNTKHGQRANVTYQFELGIPANARSLIWHEFFFSRGRGRDWTSHLPWAQDQGTFSATAMQSGITLATLVIRRSYDTSLAMVGFVCVGASARGQGLSTTLIDFAAAAATKHGFREMMLWTTKPRVYERCGFAVCQTEERLSLNLNGKRPARSPVLQSWPNANATSAGLPPFARSCWSAETPTARIVFADTPTGPTLLDHQGPADAVLDLAMQAQPGTWSAVLRSNDALCVQAKLRGFVSARANGPITMFRSLSGEPRPPAYIPPAFRI